MATHTPGPWKVYDDWIVNAKGETIARIYRQNEQEQRNNAQLMALAPEMRDELDRIRKFLRDIGNRQEISPELVQELNDLMSRSCSLLILTV